MLILPWTTRSGGMYQIDGGGIAGGGGIIKSTRPPPAVPIPITQTSGVAAVTANAARLYSSNGSAQHAAATKHAAVVAHLTGKFANYNILVESRMVLNRIIFISNCKY